MNRSDAFVGMTVRIDSPRFPGVWRITKINPKNIKCTNEAGRNVNAHPSFLTPVDGDVPVAPVAPRPVYVHHVVGSVVEVRGKRGKFVVLREGRNETYSIVKLGGDAGRYFTGVHASFITPSSAE